MNGFNKQSWWKHPATAMTAGGVATPFFMDYLAHDDNKIPVVDTIKDIASGKADRSRIGNMILNGAIGVGTGALLREGKIKEGVGTFSLAPAKDLLIASQAIPGRINKVLDEVPAAMNKPEATATANAIAGMNRTNAILAGVLGAGALGLGGVALHKYLKKRDDIPGEGGTITYKLKGKKGDPDSEATVSIPINTPGFSPKMVEGLNSGIKRGLGKTVRLNSYKRDPQTGKMIPWEDWDKKYGSGRQEAGGVEAGQGGGEGSGDIAKAAAAWLLQVHGMQKQANREWSEGAGTLLTSVGGATAGSVIGKMLAERAGMSGLLGSVLGGGLLGLAPLFAAKGLAGATKVRTTEDQEDHDSRSAMAEYLVPGYGMYQYEKRKQSESEARRQVTKSHLNTGEMPDDGSGQADGSDFTSNAAGGDEFGDEFDEGGASSVSAGGDDDFGDDDFDKDATLNALRKSAMAFLKQAGPMGSVVSGMYGANYRPSSPSVHDVMSPTIASNNNPFDSLRKLMDEEAKKNAAKPTTTVPQQPTTTPQQTSTPAPAPAPQSPTQHTLWSGSSTPWAPQGQQNGQKRYDWSRWLTPAKTPSNNYTSYNHHINSPSPFGTNSLSNRYNRRTAPGGGISNQAGMMNQFNKRASWDDVKKKSIEFLKAATGLNSNVTRSIGSGRAQNLASPGARQQYGVKSTVPGRAGLNNRRAQAPQQRQNTTPQQPANPNYTTQNLKHDDEQARIQTDMQMYGMARERDPKTGKLYSIQETRARQGQQQQQAAQPQQQAQQQQRQQPAQPYSLNYSAPQQQQAQPYSLDYNAPQRPAQQSQPQQQPQPQTQPQQPAQQSQPQQQPQAQPQAQPQQPAQQPQPQPVQQSQPQAQPQPQQAQPQQPEPAGQYTADAEARTRQYNLEHYGTEGPVTAADVLNQASNQAALDSANKPEGSNNGPKADEILNYNGGSYGMMLDKQNELFDTLGRENPNAARQDAHRAKAEGVMARGRDLRARMDGLADKLDGMNTDLQSRIDHIDNTVDSATENAIRKANPNASEGEIKRLTEEAKQRDAEWKRMRQANDNMNAGMKDDGHGNRMMAARQRIAAENASPFIRQHKLNEYEDSTNMSNVYEKVFGAGEYDKLPSAQRTDIYRNYYNLMEKDPGVTPEEALQRAVNMSKGQMWQRENNGGRYGQII